MKVGIHTPYLDILGGGERYALTVAEFFLNRGDDVTIFWNKEFDLKKAEERFYLNLKGAKVSKKSVPATKNFDLIFWVSDGSIPFSLAKKNILHFQHPFNTNQRSFTNIIKLKKFNAIVCNSYFTKKFIDKSYGVESTVLYPPVDTDRFKPGKKTKKLLSVGRFFSPSNPKNQKFLIEEFKKLSKKLPGWELVLLGGIAPEHQDQLQNLENLAKGSNIKIISNVNYEVLQENFEAASIYWHAAGFGYDLEIDPQKAEHFGITTVEAMSAGCVPVVFAGGGQLEIITDNKNGLFWKTPEELAEKTLGLVSNQTQRNKLSKEAIERSKAFSKQKFFDNLESLCG